MVRLLMLLGMVHAVCLLPSNQHASLHLPHREPGRLCSGDSVSACAQSRVSLLPLEMRLNRLRGGADVEQPPRDMSGDGNAAEPLEAMVDEEVGEKNATASKEQREEDFDILQEGAALFQVPAPACCVERYAILSTDIACAARWRGARCSTTRRWSSTATCPCS